MVYIRLTGTMTLLSSAAASLALLCLLSGVQAGVVEPRGSTGCGKSHDFVGKTREFSFESSGGTRTYRIHLPSNYEPKKAKPLLIAYHGKGNNPEKFERETRFSEEGINPEMITIYPLGIKVWQTQRNPGCAPSPTVHAITREEGLT